MAIEVDTNEEVRSYETATKWVIDSNECLHIVGPEGNVASYYRGAWNHVRVANPGKAAHTPA